MPRKGSGGADKADSLESGWRTGERRILANPDKAAADGRSGVFLDAGLYDDLVLVLREMDQLLQYLPDDRIREFAKSETFERYQRLFERIAHLPVEGTGSPGRE